MIQPFTHADLADIAHLQPDSWQDIGAYFRFYLGAPFCRAFKIEDNRRIVALGALVLHAETAWLAHIIVAPGMRRKGLGKRVTRQLIDQAEAYGRVTQLLIATGMGEPLYEQLGFRRSCDYRFYCPPTRGACTLPVAVRRMEPADVPRVMKMDASASGEDRRSLLSAYVNNGFVYTGTGGKGLSGFYLPDLGEGLIVAQDAEAGQALMELRLAGAEAPPVLPAANLAANRFLSGLGLGVKSTAARMVRNGADPLQPDMLFNRVGGHLG